MDCSAPDSIEDIFKDRSIAFSDGSEWELIHKYSEKCRYSSAGRGVYDDDNKELEPPEASEATAVFEVRQMSSNGPASGSSSAVIKIHMQIPFKTFLDANADDRAKEAGLPFAEETEMELQVLRRATDMECEHTPRLLSWKEEKQTWDMWVPGGYIVFILMSKLPGIRLSRSIFNDQFYSLEKRNQIREAFRVALTSFFRLRSEPMDSKLENLIWDQATGRCYMIDFEDCQDVAPYPEHVSRWDDAEWFLWGLARHFGGDVIW